MTNAGHIIMVLQTTFDEFAGRQCIASNSSVICLKRANYRRYVTDAQGFALGGVRKISLAANVEILHLRDKCNSFRLLQKRKR